MPIAIQKRVTISFSARADGRVRVRSDKAPGDDWRKYVHAATEAFQNRQPLKIGMDAFITSDLPMAAGLSSSSALLIAVSLALMRVNDVQMPLNELIKLLAEGEHFVGTRGGAMDHVAILASRAGFATLIQSFDPLEIDYVPIPPDWRFLIAHSLIYAEKSGALRSEYNARPAAGRRALQRLGFHSYREVLAKDAELCAGQLSDQTERDAFVHVATEARRVQQAVAALKQADLYEFGRLLVASHASLGGRLRVSLPPIDALVDGALQAGAFGARLTGAGFGGCIVCLCTAQNVEHIRQRLIETYYAQRPEFDPAQHLFIAHPVGSAS